MRAESLQEAVDGAWDIKAATCTVASGWRKAMVAYPTAFVAARFTGTKLLARTSERGRKCSGSHLRAAVERKFCLIGEGWMPRARALQAMFLGVESDGTNGRWAECRG